MAVTPIRVALVFIDDFAYVPDLVVAAEFNNLLAPVELDARISSTRHALCTAAIAAINAPGFVRKLFVSFVSKEMPARSNHSAAAIGK